MDPTMQHDIAGFVEASKERRVKMMSKSLYTYVAVSGIGERDDRHAVLDSRDDLIAWRRRPKNSKFIATGSVTVR